MMTKKNNKCRHEIDTHLINKKNYTLLILTRRTISKYLSTISPRQPF